MYLAGNKIFKSDLQFTAVALLKTTFYSANICNKIDRFCNIAQQIKKFLQLVFIPACWFLTIKSFYFCTQTDDDKCLLQISLPVHETEAALP